MKITIEELKENSKFLEYEFDFTTCKWDKILSRAQKELEQFIVWGWHKSNDLKLNNQAVDVKMYALYNAVMDALSNSGSSGIAYGIRFNKSSFSYGHDFSNNEKDIPWSQWR
jgi:hypothetical protein